MSETTETVKIKPTTADQGDYVIINKSDLTKEHELIDEEAGSKKPAALTVDQIKAALAEKNVQIPDGITKKPDLQALLDAS